MSALMLDYSEPPIYVAVCRYGYGIDEDPVKAILGAQEHVPLADKPSQLLIYRETGKWEDELEPIGFKNGAPVWQNGTRPQLAGLTNTHAGFRKRPRI